MQTNKENTFRLMLDAISSNLIAKQWGYPYIWAPREVKNLNFDQNDPKYWYYAINFPVCTI
jgi:hypothetical protein